MSPFKKDRRALNSDPIPVRAGIGLKPQHYQDVLETNPDVGWFEVHTENYMGAGGAPHFFLEKIREKYPLSMHGVGLSLGSADGVSLDHLKAVKKAVDRYQPALVSEHISWSVANGVYLNDLIPLPYTPETLQLTCDHIEQVQDFLGRQILVENPSTYLLLHASVMEEPEFLNQILARTGCGLLLDVNNVYVSCENHGWDAQTYLAALKPDTVQEIHLAGHSLKTWRGKTLRIDDHGTNVSRDVWALYDYTLKLMGPKPSLIEWDSNIPSLMTLQQEAHRADIFLKTHGCQNLQEEQDYVCG
ncbi:DUF692 domain-containing protein [Paremcibacter congregatus]|uniref:UPF0276 protein CRD36_15375 n=1 Tax=Paremcibacter congregatus TaxID=2043170 RepID=A0A2G4YN72_9PROT|nr:DUF692 domain-containing protein [Paremcibacter congregatus]PHZ83745.1 hypothetical protein CRD36_15375 [Paremcibacter congregatus]QDE27446.1 DUF692 domain-containing protein [Paremcibacter congregatus]